MKNRHTNSFCLYLLIICLYVTSCKTDDPNVFGPEEDTTIIPAVDPDIAKTIGFFLEDWSEKTFVEPTNTLVTTPSVTTYTIEVDASIVLTKIPQSIFGHNAVWWQGPISNEYKFTDPVTKLNPHIIRFPGGSSSDVYFWNAQHGVIPSDVPEEITNQNGVKEAPGYMFGMSNYNWVCNVDDYYSMLEKTHNQGLITVNYGYARYGTGSNPVGAAAHLAADWVRYDNGRTKYWEVGNENFGAWEWGYRIDKSLNQDGQPEYISGDLYAQHFQIFADSMKKAATEIGSQIYIGAVTAESSGGDTWNSGLITSIDNKADFYVLHNYFTPYNENSSSATIFSSALEVPKNMMSYFTQKLLACGAAIKPVVLDEWNMWAQGSKQQVSNVSGGFSLIILGELIKNKFGLAARWDLINGWNNGNDHGLFSAGDEPGVLKWSPRPSFYYLYFFQKMIGDRLVSSTSAKEIVTYASTYSSGELNITLVNISSLTINVEIKTKNFRKGEHYYWYSLEGGTDNGEFSRKVIINGIGPSGDAGGPSNYSVLSARSASTSKGIKIRIPPRGAVVMVVDKK